MERATEVEELLVNFYNGAHALELVAAWASAVANREVVHETLALFEKSYERLVELHAAGKLGAGTAEFSAVNLEVVKRINQLIGPGLDSNEARKAAREIHALAERCVRALKGSDAPPAG
ncbi:hypothetical protein [Sorangium sp. So ce131]|uniref:hypothetical protein n=1 Tax=Sorangium sp. So ce131 TaxID=3133282 RepID=UPI003F645BCA